MGLPSRAGCSSTHKSGLTQASKRSTAGKRVVFFKMTLEKLVALDNVSALDAGRLSTPRIKKKKWRLLREAEHNLFTAVWARHDDFCAGDFCVEKIVELAERGISRSS